MKRRLTLTENEANKIIRREVAIKLRRSNFYDLATGLSTTRCNLPPKNGRHLDFDYQLTEVGCEYKIEESESIPLKNIVITIPAKVLDYKRIFADPYMRPGGSQVANLNCAIECRMASEVTLTVDQDEQDIWIGRIDWHDVVIDSSMIKIINPW